MLTFLTQILSIIVINVVLSGDNALVIGMASRSLEPRQRRQAILFGGAGAIVLRVIFTFIAVLLLRVPLLEAAGGVMLVWIAFRLLQGGEEAGEVAAGQSLAGAVKTIIVADMVMSLDNMLAVAGAADGSDRLVIFGLAVSMPFILFGAGLIARLLNRFNWLMIAGSGVLTITAAHMVVSDEYVSQRLAGWAEPALPLLAALFTAIVVTPVVVRWRRTRLERLEARLRRPQTARRTERAGD